MSTLQELQLKPEAIEPGVTFDQLPEGFGPRIDPLQPGTYRFALPKDCSAIWEKFEATIPIRTPDGQEGDRAAERIRAAFDGDAPLVIIQSAVGLPDRTGEAFYGSLSNAERWRDRDHAIKASDLDYLLKALGETVHPGYGNNIGYAQAVMRHPEGPFTADMDLTYFCSPKREIYAADGKGGSVKVAGVFGNSARYRAGTGPQDIQKDPQSGLYPTTIEVVVQAQDPQTGQMLNYTALVRGFNNFNRIRA